MKFCFPSSSPSLPLERSNVTVALNKTEALFASRNISMHQSTGLPEKPEFSDNLLRDAPLAGHLYAKGAACLGNNTAATLAYTDVCLMPATSVTISNTTVPFTCTNHGGLGASTTTRVSIP